MTNKVADGGMWRSHLEAALLREGETIILASMDDKRGLVMQCACMRPQDMVDVARSLLEQAKDRTSEELQREDGDSQGDDPREELVSILDEVLGILPDPNEDD